MTALTALLACGDPEPAAEAPEPPPSTTETPEPSRPAVDALEQSLRAALDSLVAGPTAEERGQGVTSWFDAVTRGVVKDVREEDGAAIVDFRESLPRLIPGAGSSAGSEALLAELDSTVFGFPAIRTVEYRLEGSCDAFWAWLQRECMVVAR